MDKEDFKTAFENVKTEFKGVRLPNNAVFIINNYSFFVDENVQMVSFGLDDKGIGYCNLADVKGIVEVYYK